MTPDECELVVRKVLNEGTAFGFQNWAQTNTGLVDVARSTFNGVAALLARSPGDVDVAALANMLKEGLGEAVAAELAERLAS